MSKETLKRFIDMIDDEDALKTLFDVIIHFVPIIMYWSDADDCYVTEVPSLPGCMSDGKSPEEALKHTYEVIKVWLECEEEGD